VNLTGPEREALHSTFHRLEQRWNTTPIPDQTVSHAWDALPFWFFLDGLRQAAELTEGRRFMDVGCGIGTKLAIAHHLGWQVSGIEKHEPYARAARDLIPEASVQVVDAFDCETFDADVVYMYRPMRSDHDQERLETHVLAHSRPGTVMFWPVRHNPEVWVI